MMCYKKACRLCLKELQGPGIDCLAIDELRETIQSLFGIKILPADITSAICNKCFEKTMNFKAFKKTVSECQSIIKEYENIRKKILQRQTSIKEEIIDLSESETENPTTSKKKNKRPTPTDSEINDILDIVHENNDTNINNSRKKGNKNASSTILRIKTERTFPDSVQSPDSGNASTRTCTKDSSPETASNENEPTNNENERENRLCPNRCGIPASEIPGTLESTVKIEYETTIPNLNVPLAVDAVSSSVRSPDKNRKEPEREDRPSTSRTIQTLQNISSPEPIDKNQCNEDSEDEIRTKADSSNIANPQPSTSWANKSNIISISNVNSTNFICSKCSEKFQSQKDLECHINEHTEDIETIAIEKRSRRKRHSEPDSTTIRRSARIAQSQTLQNLFNPGQKRFRRRTYTTSPKKNSSELPIAIAQLALSQQRLARTHASSPATSDPSSSSSAYLEYARSQSNRHSKRIITITLLRSKDSVNFRYCDQYKNIIDFESVTAEELCDIRSSLMSPNIWNNLTDVFKTSTPDDETITQLKTIFGQGFRWS